LKKSALGVQAIQVSTPFHFLISGVIMDHFIKDIDELYTKFGFDVSHLAKDQLYEFVKWRADFIQEELNELFAALDERDCEEVVDACIDIIVVSLGTLHMLNVDSFAAWKEVQLANLEKRLGEKAGRRNPFGFPDLIKTPEWKSPDHSGNCGLLNENKS
jgi:predicted HAD superfamily Cof-like phosphohydrolase